MTKTRPRRGRLQTLALAGGGIFVGWVIVVSQNSMLTVWEPLAPSWTDHWNALLPAGEPIGVSLDDFNPWLAALGALIVALSVRSFFSGALRPRTGPGKGAGAPCPAPLVTSTYLLGPSAVAGPLMAAGIIATAVVHGAGWQIDSPPGIASTELLHPSLFGYCLALAFAACLVIAPFRVVRRMSRRARRNIEWCAWVNSLGPEAGRTALQYSPARERAGIPAPQGHEAGGPAGPTQIGSLHNVHRAYGAFTGHPMAIPVSLALTAAKVGANAYLKKTYTPPDPEEVRREQIRLEEVRRAKLAATATRLEQVLEEQAALKCTGSWRGHRRCQRDLRRTQELLQTVQRIAGTSHA